MMLMLRLIFQTYRPTSRAAVVLPPCLTPVFASQLGDGLLFDRKKGATFIVNARYTQTLPRTLELTFEEARVCGLQPAGLLEALIAPAILPRTPVQHQLLLAINEVCHLKLAGSACCVYRYRFLTGALACSSRRVCRFPAHQGCLGETAGQQGSTYCRTATMRCWLAGHRPAVYTFSSGNALIYSDDRLCIAWTMYKQRQGREPKAPLFHTQAFRCNASSSCQHSSHWPSLCLLQQRAWRLWQQMLAL